MPFTGQVRKDSTHGGAVFFLSAWELPYRGWDQRLTPSAEKIGCRILWKSYVRTLSVIAIGYIVSQTAEFVKGKCEICKEEKFSVNSQSKCRKGI